MPQPPPRSDVLLAVMGGPHADDLTTSLLRLAQALLDRGGRVQVWTCGYATALTQCALGEHKPRNVVDWSRDYATTATLVTGLLAAHPDRLDWSACRFCSEERAMVGHLPQVRVRPPFVFGQYVAAADRTLFLGVI